MRNTILSFLLFWFCTISPVQGQDFFAGFSIHEIPDSIWQKMQGKTWQPNDVIGRSDLRYLRLMHWDYDGKTHHGEMADDYDADDEQQMRDNNSSCFCYRTVSGRQHLSYHARGLAVDINTLYNPYVRTGKNGERVVEPSTAVPYCDRQKTFRYKITKGDLCYRLFIKNGFIWGGSWQTVKDYQHFEYHP